MGRVKVFTLTCVQCRACLSSSVAVLWQPLVEVPQQGLAAVPANEEAGAAAEGADVAEPEAPGMQPGAALCDVRSGCACRCMSPRACCSASKKKA